MEHVMKKKLLKTIVVLATLSLASCQWDALLDEVKDDAANYAINKTIEELGKAGSQANGEK
tara:strand:- start:161 stop:343 length:183 start_codon:yes stop_codon:yes gene_type:complete